MTRTGRIQSARYLALVTVMFTCWVTPLAKSEESLPNGMKVVSIKALPKAIELNNKFDYRQILLTGLLDTGAQVDLTRIAELAESSKYVSISETGIVRPQADGAGQLNFTYDDQSVTIPIKVTGTKADRPVSFVLDVAPAMSKMSCNAGTCHGSKDGKNGFKLSLRGYDQLYDHRALTDDLAARRINRSAPEQSLMLLKTSGSIPHVGGVRSEPGEPHYEILRSWIAGGAKLDLDAAKVAKIELFPQGPVLPLAGMRQQLAVIATFTDGSVRDVTAEAFVESGNIEVAEADENSIMTTLRRGEAAVLARYQGAYTATTITVMGDRSGFVWQETPSNNYIDKLVHKKLQLVKVLSSDLCTDAEFVRRVYLDLTGLPPTIEQTTAFLDDKTPSKEKRDQLIDHLVGGGSFTEHWTNKWADLLLVNRKFLGEEGSFAFRNWIKQAVASNMPYDRFVYEVLTARGSNVSNPPASYYKTLRDPSDVMENTTQLFLGVRFSCNKCHDHPFERWTQSQYYHMSAFFAQVGRKTDPAFAGRRIGGTAVEGAKPLVEVIYDKTSGDVKHLLTGQISPPKFPYQNDLATEASSRREQLAAWVTSPKNQYFAKSYVNRLWGYLLSVGIIEPIDDIRAGNPPTNPELLDALTTDFIQSGFDTQHIIRTICKSRTYQLSVATNQFNEDDQINYSHALPKRLPAEALFDAIHLATGSTIRLPGVPVGFRAAELPDSGLKVPFLTDFGRPPREAACECERSSGMVLGPIMKLVNGPTVAKAISDPQNALARLVAAEKDDRVVVEKLFLRFLSRKPTEEEMSLCVETIAETKAAKDQDPRLLGVQDLAWALINNPAFLFNR